MTQERVKITYEVHTLKDDRWIIDQIDGSAKMAIDQAKELYSQKYLDAVKVIEERYDSYSNESRDKIIFEANRHSKREGPTSYLADSIKKNKENRKSAKAAKKTKLATKKRPKLAAVNPANDSYEDTSGDFFSLPNFIIILLSLMILGTSAQWLYSRGYIDLSGLGFEYKQPQQK